jgi:hypothetical protein
LGILRGAKKNDIFSSRQNEFQKGRGTRDCLALLTTDVQTSFETKQHICCYTVAAFIDIFGAYDNVLIDIICNILIDKEEPSKIVRFLACLLWRNVLVLFTGGREYVTLAGYKGLPQGSVLSPFLYNVIGSCADKFVPAGCGFFQYADDLVVYATHRLIEVALGTIQTACTSLVVFFSSMGLKIFTAKSEVMLFSRKHEHPSILIRIGSHVLP